MPGIATGGKLFFKLFFERFGRRWRKSRFCQKRRLSSHDVPVSGLAGRVASCQENNPAEMVAMARRIRRAPPGQNRGAVDSERVRPDLRNRA
jgi:hypothetical protein